MRICKRCLEAIECKEGYQPNVKILVDDTDDEAQSTCEWCEESGFETLYEI